MQGYAIGFYVGECEAPSETGGVESVSRGVDTNDS